MKCTKTCSRACPKKAPKCATPNPEPVAGYQNSIRSRERLKSAMTKVGSASTRFRNWNASGAEQGPQFQCEELQGDSGVHVSRQLFFAAGHSRVSPCPCM